MSVTRISWVPIKAGVDDAALAPLTAAGAALAKQPGIESIYHGRVLDGATPSLYALTCKYPPISNHGQKQQN